MERVRWAIVGTGRMAAALAAELRASGDRHDVVAIVSRRIDTARAFASRHGIRKALDDVGQAARDPEVDAVYVATPHTQHHRDMLACVRGGKAVLCEKPFTLNAAQAREVIDEARREGVFVMEAMWTRFLPAVVELRRRLDAREIGRIRLIAGGGAFVPAADPGHYLFDPARGGGVLLDAGVYLLSMASMILGPPERVHACGSLHHTGVDDQDVMLLSYPGGAHAALYVSMKARRPPDLELLGEDGRIRIEAPIFRPTQLTSWNASGQERREQYPVAGSGYGAQIREVAMALHSGRTESAVLPLEETLSIMQAMDTVRAQIGLHYPGEPS